MIIGNNETDAVGAGPCARPDNGEQLNHHDVDKGRTRRCAPTKIMRWNVAQQSQKKGKQCGLTC